jgi:small subunit ribosomal protein S14
MPHNEIRPIVKQRSAAGTGYTYVTRKNRRNDPDRLRLRKYDPVIRRHVEFSRGALMAKQSKIARNQQRRAVGARYAVRRTEIKAIIRSPASTAEQRQAAQSALARQPRDASAVRLRNRDAVDGRPRGHLRKFGLSRVRMRQLAHAGQLPGVRKASW